MDSSSKWIAVGGLESKRWVRFLVFVDEVDEIVDEDILVAYGEAQPIQGWLALAGLVERI